jgi:6-phosphofructo-2-kinase/fructose-2,6-biphosphatase 2
MTDPEPETNGFFAPQMRKVPTGDLVKPSKRTNGVGVQAEDTRICVVMVGLPARGKSLIAQKGKVNASTACLVATYTSSP